MTKEHHQEVLDTATNIATLAWKGKSCIVKGQVGLLWFDWGFNEWKGGVALSSDGVLCAGATSLSLGKQLLPMTRHSSNFWETSNDSIWWLSDTVTYIGCHSHPHQWHCHSHGMSQSHVTVTHISDSVLLCLDEWRLSVSICSSSGSFVLICYVVWSKRWMILDLVMFKVYYCYYYILKT